MSLNNKLANKIKNKQQIKPPKMYKVMLHNDDYTTMNFVTELLVKIFDKTLEEAKKIMYLIHEKGQGIAGIYSYDIAYSKVQMVELLAKEHQFPLKASVENA